MRWASLVIRTFLFCALASTAIAQPPLIYNRSIYNAASYMPAGVPGGAIARGSIFSIFGARLGPAQFATANTYPLGTTLSNVSITVSQGTATVNALPIYVSASQINAIMPSTAPLGAAAVQVSFNNARSNMAPVRIASSAFGIFTATGTGLGPGVLQNYVDAATQPINSPTVTAQNGQVITLWGTGLGPVTGGDNVAPTQGNLPVQVDVFVGGIAAPVLYSGRTPCCSGTDQIVFKVPDNAPAGCWVPVYVRTGGAAISNVATIALDPAGGACSSDVLPGIASIVVNGGKLGKNITVRAVTRHDAGTRAPVDVTGDYHARLALAVTQTAFPFSPMFSYPPSGTCTAYAAQGDLLGGDFLPGSAPQSNPLDFGAPFQITGPRGSKTLTPVSNGYLGGLISNNILPNSLFLDPGSYTVKGFGGPDIGVFSSSFTIPQPLTWTNKNQLSSVNRTQPLTVSWTGGDPRQVVAIAGFGVDLPTNSSGMFACIAPAGVNSFTVPAAILANLPATRPNLLQSKDVIYVLSLPGASVQSFSATGLDLGLTLFSHINGKTVVIQ